MWAGSRSTSLSTDARYLISQLMLVFFQELANRPDGLVLAGIADQIQRFIFAQRALFVRDSGAFHDGADAGGIGQRYHLRKRRDVLVYRAYGILARSRPRSWVIAPFPHIYSVPRIGLSVVRWFRRSSSNPFHHSSPRWSGMAGHESSHLSNFRFSGRRRAEGRPAPDAVGLDSCLRAVGVFAVTFPQIRW